MKFGDIVGNVCIKPEMLSKHLIWTILGAGLLLRLVGFFNGFPEVYVTDEFRFIGIATKILSNRDLNPHWFGHPGGFIIYLLCLFVVLICGCHFITLLIQGQTGGWGEYIATYGKNPDFNPAVFLVAGKLMIILFALISIYLLYRIGKKYFHPIVGLIASAVLALAPLHIDHSQKVRTDVATTMWVLFAIYYLLKYIDHNQRKLLLISAFCGGLSVATKYTSGLILFPIIAIAWRCNTSCLRSDINNSELPKRSSVIVQVLLFFFLGFFIFSPFVVIDHSSAIKDMIVEARSVHVGAESEGILANYLWYLREAFNRGIGNVLIEIMAFIGMFAMLKRSRISNYVFILFPLLFFLIVGAGRLRWERWMIPVLPFEALFFGYGVYFLSQKVKIFGRKNILLAILVLYTAFAFGWVIKRDFHDARKRSRPDNRTLARDWVLDNIPAGKSIAYEIYGPHLVERYAEKYNIEYLGWLLLSSHPFEYYVQNRFDYIIKAADRRSIYQKQPERFRKELTFIKELENNCTLVKYFSDEQNPGPSTWIYKLDSSQGKLTEEINIETAF